MFANCTSAVRMAITSPIANARTVSGIVYISPGRRIFGKDWIRIFKSRSFIFFTTPIVFIGLQHLGGIIASSLTECIINLNLLQT